MHQAPDYIDFSSMSHEAIAAFLRTYHLGLTVEEALTIQEQLLQRAPSFAECVLWSIQGSEHCSYKSTRQYLQQLNTQGRNVILGAKEDAGIIAIAKDHTGKRYGLVVSHESHNHPSQIVPYEGAATGVGGNVRDVCCMGAEVIAVADSLRFGEINRTKTLWLHEGIVAGIGGYGNPLGIPNIAGDVYYDEGYNENCLVTVVTLGIVREDHIIHSYAPHAAKDYVYILVGKPTDNSGFGGASFASAQLDEDKKEENKGAVQEPNAFLQRHLLKANYALFEKLRERQLIDKVGFKDLGAGGIACASVEMAEAAGLGAEIDLDLIPTSMHDLNPAVVLCSETQERFMWVVPPDLVDLVLQHYNETFALPNISKGARAAVVGKIRTDGRFVVRSQQNEIVNAKAADITKGILYDRKYHVNEPVNVETNIAANDQFNNVLLKILTHENIASREVVYETYDKQVQGRTCVEAGHADAGILQPFNEEKYPEEIRQVGVALSLDQNPRYNKIDPYWGAVNAVLESVRNVTAVGAMPVAITDCLCFGNPEKPEQMGQFVEAVRGIRDATQALVLNHEDVNGLPVIAGNVSLYNESQTGAIPASPMISCVGMLADVKTTVQPSFKERESLLILVGERRDECGGSVFYQLYNELGTQLPQPNLTSIAQEILTVHAAMNEGLVLSAHDISDGGIATALVEMTFLNLIGIRVNIPGQLAIEKKLFSETGGFILEVSRANFQKFRKLFDDAQIPIFIIGETTQDATIHINDVIEMPIVTAKEAWLGGLRNKLD